MSEQPTMQEYVDAAREILEALLRQMEFADAQVQSAIEDDQIFFEIVTADAGRLIGRTSQTLDAVQFLVNRLLSRRFEDSPYCVVDTEQYRARRREKLLADAQEALQHVRSTGQSWRMPLLNAMDRRVIHQALKDCPDIETYSEDEEPDGRKRVVICLTELPPVEAEPADGAPEADGAAADAPAEPA
jgi:spoIIIJ-associated protein